MRICRLRAFVVLAAALFAAAASAPAPLPAQDLSFYDVGAKAAALGGAFTARADDITAIFYNPAGLAFLDGVRIKTSLGFGSRTINATRSDNGQTLSGGAGEFRGDFFASWRPVRRMSLGLGFFSPANFSSRWLVAWPLDTISTISRFNAQTLRSVVAIEPLKGLALSAAFDLVLMTAGWRHKIAFEPVSYPPSGPALATSFHDLRGSGTGFAAGLLWKTLPWLQAGARYQTSDTVTLRGRNTFLIPYSYELLPVPGGAYRTVSEIMGWFYTDQVVTGRLTLPRQIACGIALTPVGDLTLSFDLRWDRGSEFGQWEFRSVNEGGDLSPRWPASYTEFYGLAPDYGVQGVDLVLQDTRRIMAGVEYRAGKWFAFRAGYASLASAADDDGRTPLYPDPGFAVYSLGAGYDGPLFDVWDRDKVASQLSFDVFVRYAVSGTATSSHPAFDLAYSGNRFLTGVSVGFAF